MNMRVEEPDGKSAQPAQSNPWLLARETLELVSSFGCQPSPKAYEVFFAYASGQETVRAEVDRAAHPDHLLTSFDLDRIHHDHFRTNEGEWERQQKASHKIEAKLGLAAGDLASHMELGEAYERELTRASGQITRTRTAEDLSALVDTLLSETGTVRNATAAMRQSLFSTQNAVSAVTRDLAATRKDGSKDLLTGLIGRRGFDVQLDTAVADSVRNGRQLMIVVISVDRFDGINGTHGRLTGDVMVRTVGRLIGRFANGDEIAARIGGVKFGLIMQGCSTREAYVTAEAIRCEIAEREFKLQETGDTLRGITVSVGMSMLVQGDTAESLLARAESELGTARARGGNAIAHGDIQIM